MIGEMDGQIQQRVDAFRGEPDKLAQRYQMDPQLLDLLALQKLKTDKEAAARQMQLQMQPQPGTIAQQRQQEVMGLTKDEMARQVGATHNQQNMEQQKRMQQLMQMGMPGAQRMAGGGVVALAEGGAPKADADKVYRRQYEILKSSGVKWEDALALAKGDPVATAIVEEMWSGSAPTGPVKGGGVADMVSSEPNLGGYMTDLREQMETARKENGYPAMVGAAARGAAGAVPAMIADAGNKLKIPGLMEGLGTFSDYLLGGSPSESPTPPMAPVAAQETPAATAATEQQDTAPTPVPEPTPQGNGAGVAALPIDNPFMKKMRDSLEKRMSIDPDVAQQEAMERERVLRSGETAKLGQLEQGTKQYQDTLAAQQDPAKLKREQLVSWLLGAGGRQNNTMFIGAGQAGQRTRKQQEAAQLAGQKDVRGMQSAEYDKLKGLNDAIMGAGNEERKSANQSIDAALTNARATADTELMARVQSETNRLRAQANMLEKQGLIDARARDSLTKAMLGRNDLYQEYAKAVAGDLKHMEYMDEAAAAMEKGNREEADRYRKLAQIQEATIQQRMGLEQRDEQFKRQIDEIFEKLSGWGTPQKQ